MLAKTITTLDVISGGRAILGLGAGWYELEHQEMGYEFGTFTERFERLEEALQIIEPMLRGNKPELDGKWYQAHGTRNQPQLRTDIPIMLGGGGEKKTFGHGGPLCPAPQHHRAATELPRKLEALGETVRRGRPGSQHTQDELPGDRRSSTGRRQGARHLVDMMKARGVDAEEVGAEKWAEAHRPVLRRFARRGRGSRSRPGCSTSASTASPST